MTVCCVLRSGGDYKPEHVSHLRDDVRRHLKMEHRFVCLTDMSVDCEKIPLPEKWPGWWSKISLFHPDIPKPIVYIDLDTIIVGPLDDLALGHRFTVLQNFWAKDRIGSGMMAWDADLSAIYSAFAKSPAKFIREYVTQDKWGDQGFIRAHTPIEPERWQRKHPGKVVSYKHHCRPGVDPKSQIIGKPVIPAGASVICHHGQPRPWRTPLWDMHKEIA